MTWQKIVFVVYRYVNNFDETFVYECTTGAGVITGADMKKSQEGKLSQVRKKAVGFAGKNQMIEFDIYQDSIAGMESEHDNGKEDRRWSYKCCAAQVYTLNF